MKSQIWLLLAFLLPAVAEAQVYKCVENGRVTYTDRPCAASAKASELPFLVVTTGPSATEKRLAHAHDERLAKGEAERDAGDAEWLKEHERSKDRAERVRKAIIEHRVIKGMTAQEVNQSLGTPAEVARSESFGSDKETWTYDLDGAKRTVNFKDRQVTTTSSRQGTGQGSARSAARSGPRKRRH
jgi:hypothetical protein